MTRLYQDDLGDDIQERACILQLTSREIYQTKVLFVLASMAKTPRRNLVHENITGYLKNHWTKHRLVCTHFNAFSMLIPNMGIFFNNSEFCEIVLKKKSIVLKNTLLYRLRKTSSDDIKVRSRFVNFEYVN